MKKTLRNIISTVLVLNMLMFAIGCTNPGANTGKDNNDSQAQLVNGPSTVNPGGSSGNNNGNTDAYSVSFNPSLIIGVHYFSKTNLMNIQGMDFSGLRLL